MHTSILCPLPYIRPPPHLSTLHLMISLAPDIADIGAVLVPFVRSNYLGLNCNCQSAYEVPSNFDPHKQHTNHCTVLYELSY